ncbi:hypothetical protein IU433_17180 [Nocardia puris]|uniref:alpha/beta hydrolase n=1 Tax=Nocardia puris TaxID=208602 RepID=UPI001896176A|nr:dienelactone hydrolase family protein [Nocardia puris]MBF6460766.1 hypothetical protein [Nocardia puris]
MSIIDGVIPAAVVVCALVVVGGVRVRRVWVAVALGVIAGLAVIQLITEGFYWQFLPTYVLLCVTALFAFFPPGRRAWSVVSRVAIALLIVPAAGAWAVTPVPELPAPSGPYLVGTETFRWVDPARDEPATPDPDDRRAVIAQAWYPAAEPTGRRAPYLDGLGDLPASVSGIPGFVFGAYADVDTLGELLATPHPDRERWPVVLFSPGYGAPRGFYTGLVAELASRGFVVLAVDHPYESAVTELPGGDLATPVAVPADPDEGERYMAAQQDVRASDLRFVLDRLDALGPRLTGRVDTEHVAVIGHSFGGAAAAATAAADPRGARRREHRRHALRLAAGTGTAPTIPAGGERSRRDGPLPRIPRPQRSAAKSVQTSQSFDDHAAAIRWAKLLDRVGAAEAERVLAAQLAATPEVLTLKVWLHRYINSLGKSVEEETRRKYRRMVDRDMIPFFGEHLPVDALTPELDAAWVDWLEEEFGNGAKTIRNKHGLLCAAMGAEVSDCEPTPRETYRRLGGVAGRAVDHHVVAAVGEIVVLGSHIVEHGLQAGPVVEIDDSGERLIAVVRDGVRGHVVIATGDRADDDDQGDDGEDRADDTENDRVRTAAWLGRCGQGVPLAVGRCGRPCDRRLGRWRFIPARRRHPATGSARRPRREERSRGVRSPA